MAFDSYSGLKAEITNWMMGRSDLATDAASFIALAEGDFNRVLRTKSQEATATVALTSSAGSLPADYLQYISVTSLENPTQALEAQSRDFVSEVYGYTYTGTPRVFVIENTTISVFPQSSSDLRLTYYAKLPSLSDSVTTNWLLDLYPNVYLFMALKYASAFIRDEEGAKINGAMANAALEALAMSDRASRFPRIAPKPRTPCP